MTHGAFLCRAGCGACCIAPSITTPIPGMPDGTPAGVRCVQLDDDFRCRLFGKPERPAVCGSLRPSEEMCGANRAEAMQRLEELETATAPTSGMGVPPMIAFASEGPTSKIQTHKQNTH